MRRFILLASFLFSSSAFSYFMPKNDLNLEDNPLILNSGIDEKKFNEIIDSVNEVYAPIVAAHGGILLFERKWDDATVNASAERVMNSWIVTMYGGLARRKEITLDGFLMVVCHELGHHLAGHYFYPNNSWDAAVEGEADRFSAGVCARKMFEKADNSAARPLVDKIAKSGCDKAYRKQNDRDLCYRIAVASKGLADLLSSNGDVSFETPDQNVVDETDPNHPRGQCRLDTFFQASLCNKVFDSKVIPGRDVKEGKNSIEAQQQAFKYSCSEKEGFGFRPHCWFYEQK